MAETEIQTDPGQNDVLAEIRKLEKTLGVLVTHVTEVHELLSRAAPLLDSKAAKVALGIERHPILSHLTGGGRRG